MTKPQVYSNIKMKMFKIRNYIKNNKLFVFFTLLCLVLPMIIEPIINYSEDKITFGIKPFFLKICYTLKEYKSYYATILTLSFAIFSFNKQQEKLFEEKQKENELREKELEADKDKYRPIFVVEIDKNNNKSARLLMKNEDFYLENIKYLTLENTDVKYRGPCKHREVIISGITHNFFVTAETLIGEIILFGYIGGKKIYKYLNTNQYPLLPMEGDYKKEEADKIWSSFNTLITGNNIAIESLFFNSTYLLRNHLVKDDYKTLHKSLQTDTLKDFFNNIFTDLNSYVKKNNMNIIGNKNNNIYMILSLFTKKLRNYKNLLTIARENRQALKTYIYRKESSNVLKNDYSEITLDTNNNLDNSSIFDIIIDDFLPDYLDNYQLPSSTPIDCLNDFEELFNYIEFDSSLDKELPLFMNIALTHLNY